MFYKARQGFYAQLSNQELGDTPLCTKLAILVAPRLLINTRKYS